MALIIMNCIFQENNIETFSESSFGSSSNSSLARRQIERILQSSNADAENCSDHIRRLVNHFAIATKLFSFDLSKSKIFRDLLKTKIDVTSALPLDMRNAEFLDYVHSDLVSDFNDAKIFTHLSVQITEEPCAEEGRVIHTIHCFLSNDKKQTLLVYENSRHPDIDEENNVTVLMEILNSAVQTAWDNHRTSIQYIIHNLKNDLPKNIEYEDRIIYLICDISIMTQKIFDITVSVSPDTANFYIDYIEKLRNFKSKIAGHILLGEAVEFLNELLQTDPIVKGSEEIRAQIEESFDAVSMAANVFDVKYRGRKILENNVNRNLTFNNFIAVEGERIKKNVNDRDSIFDMVSHYQRQTSYFTAQLGEEKLSNEQFWKIKRCLSADLYDLVVNLLVLPATSTKIDGSVYRKNLRSLHTCNLKVHHVVVASIMMQDG